MTAPYRSLFTAPGSTGFALAGLLARMALPMTGIGIITMLAQLRGSYTLAGAVSASFVLSYALMSPRISRRVDRLGQRRVLPVATAISVLGLLLLAASAWAQGPDWSLFLAALMAGFMPSISAMVRARWTALYRGQPCLQTAQSLETVLDEASFIAGPPLSVALCIAVWPQAGLLAAAALLLTGVAALVAQRRTEPPVSPAQPMGQASLLGIAPLRLLVLLMVAMGVIVGSIDIVSVAFAEQSDQPAAAGLVLAAYAAGSCLAGLAFGARHWKTPLHRLLLLGGLATAVSTLPLPLTGSMPALAAAVLGAGLFFAPTMIIAMSLVERLVPEHQLTEGMTWLLAGLNVGVALGAATSGHVVDTGGAAAGFNVAICAGAAVLLLAVAASRLLDVSSFEGSAT